MMNRNQCLAVLSRIRSNDTVVVTTMGSAAPWSRLSESELDFASVSSAMAHAADFALGLALAQPQRPVWVLNGDGSMLMSLGTLVTICQTPPPNLVLFVLHNDTYEVTGNQPVPGAGRIDMVQLARGAGFAQVGEFCSDETMARTLPDMLAEPGPWFINLRIETGAEPAPSLDRPLFDCARALRNALVDGASISA
ncbi:MAG: thiamine pyrophosphate-dependent enzyme [Lentisphaeria bacterium]|jgi:thiamine pyrophosphate-dependent acetolactate synthase large subunit-like protein|nr:thiamine pyrophosphate-dependent enzyme [Lentisphaeria bacterium]